MATTMETPTDISMGLGVGDAIAHAALRRAPDYKVLKTQHLQYWTRPVVHKARAWGRIWTVGLARGIDVARDSIWIEGVTPLTPAESILLWAHCQAHEEKAHRDGTCWDGDGPHWYGAIPDADQPIEVLAQALRLGCHRRWLRAIGVGTPALKQAASLAFAAPAQEEQ